MFLVDLAQRDKVATLTSIVSESLPHLKRGAMLDFLNLMQQHNYYDDNRWNKSDYTYTFETGSKIEFFSIDQPRKVRGPRRDRLFINEANNTPRESFEQLEIRTKEFVIIDYNPTNEFWAQEIMLERTDFDFLILTYLDNEALDPAIRTSLEMRKTRTEWWKVYGLGQLGQVEGRIYTDWKLDLDEVPHEAKLLRYGLDFGYTNDPTAVIAVYSYNGGIILDEILYAKGMLNGPIKDTLLANTKALVVADCSEPKSIDEIKAYNVPIIGSVKGKDSVRNGIAYVQEQRISVTKRSINVIREYRNYLWATDINGAFIQPGEPEHEFSHSMDAVRYGVAYDTNFKKKGIPWPKAEKVNPAL